MKFDSEYEARETDLVGAHWILSSSLKKTHADHKYRNHIYGYLPVELPAERHPFWRHYAIKNDTARKVTDVTVRRYPNLKDLKVWWQMNSLGHDRISPFDSPLWKPIIRKFEQGSAFYLALLKNKPSGCLAFEKFHGILNCWGIAVIPEVQGCGVFKGSLSLALMQEEQTEARFRCQVNLDSPSYHYFTRLPGCTIECVETRYDVP